MATLGLDSEWSAKIENLRKQTGMEECGCGRYFDPNNGIGAREHDRCRPCRKQARG